MLTVLRRRRGFRYLWLAQVVSRLGDELLLLALPFSIFEMTGSAAAAGTAYAAGTAAGLVVSPFAGVVVDTFDRRRLLVGSSAFCAVAAMAIFFAAEHGSLPGIYAALFLLECGAAVFVPARSALTPSLVPRDELLPANALSQSAVGVTG